MSLVFERSRKKARLPIYSIMSKERSGYRVERQMAGQVTHNLEKSFNFILDAIGTHEGF